MKSFRRLWSDDFSQKCSLITSFDPHRHEIGWHTNRLLGLERNLWSYKNKVQLQAMLTQIDGYVN
ncbi:hypothetical protein P5673_000371 [Acropora cervicornis]|uniref:Uncharacterized protein n=1 Tax=Acropora cervicornis TaxID=6130 RepID=A0AAD9VHQ1_ACRCE|nr:hypothetical protein P5673_000371 [Acropora cervicornis]